MPAIREAAANAFTFDPGEEAERQAIAEEGARVWVVTSTGERGRAADLAGYLEYHGLRAPRRRADADARGGRAGQHRDRATTGPRTGFPATIAWLEAASRSR